MVDWDGREFDTVALNCEYVTFPRPAHLLTMAQEDPFA